LNNALQAVVAGKTFTPVRVRHHDELGRLTATCNELMLAQQSALHDTTRVMSALVAGDLSQRIEGQLCGELGQMQAHINHSLVQLTLTFDEFNQLMAKSLQVTLAAWKPEVW
jgi:methyl-accepting chemotaxis protein